MIPYLKPALIALTVAGLFGGGWLVRGYYEDSQELVAMKVGQAVADELRDDLGQVSRDLEEQLKGVSPGVIDRGVIREIQTPVFHNVCIPPGSQSFGMLNRIAAGESAGEPSGQGGQDTTATD